MVGNNEVVVEMVSYSDCTCLETMTLCYYETRKSGIQCDFVVKYLLKLLNVSLNYACSLDNLKYSDAYMEMMMKLEVVGVVCNCFLFWYEVGLLT